MIKKFKALRYLFELESGTDRGRLNFRFLVLLSILWAAGFLVSKLEQLGRLILELFGKPSHPWRDDNLVLTFLLLVLFALASLYSVENIEKKKRKRRRLPPE